MTNSGNVGNINILTLSENIGNINNPTERLLQYQ